MKIPTITYIDGFNLYHSIDELGRPELKWLNLWSLAESLIRKNEELVEVNYFSAYTPGRIANHLLEDSYFDKSGNVISERPIEYASS